MMEQETTTTKRITSFARKKQIQYSCGCRYLFNHQIILDYVCSEHERELISHHGWDCILKYWTFKFAIILLFSFVLLRLRISEKRRLLIIKDCISCNFPYDCWAWASMISSIFWRIEKNLLCMHSLCDCRP
jgi:hypothetical protein